MIATDSRKLWLGDWSEVAERAHQVRHEVFVMEQGVPEEMELDAFDDQALHVLVELNTPENYVIATGRMAIVDGEFFSGRVGRIGRLAVRQTYRRLGIGQQMLIALVQAGFDRGLTAFELHAQLSARALYERHGFIVQGDIFNEAGIEHVLMVRGTE